MLRDVLVPRPLLVRPAPPSQFCKFQPLEHVAGSRPFSVRSWGSWGDCPKHRPGQSRGGRIVPLNPACHPPQVFASHLRAPHELTSVYQYRINASLDRHPNKLAVCVMEPVLQVRLRGMQRQL